MIGGLFIFRKGDFYLLTSPGNAGMNLIVKSSVWGLWVYMEKCGNAARTYFPSLSQAFRAYLSSGAKLNDRRISPGSMANSSAT